MADGAAWLVDQILPERPIRQWVLSLPFPMRFLLSTHPSLIGRVLGIVYRVIAGHLIRQAGFTQQSARTGAVTLIQRFGSALNLNIHFHMLFVDGAYLVTPPHDNRPRFQWVREPTSRSEEHTSELQSRGQLVCRLLLEKKNLVYDLPTLTVRVGNSKSSYSTPTQERR